MPLRQLVLQAENLYKLKLRLDEIHTCKLIKKIKELVISINF